jgi:thermopsin
MASSHLLRLAVVVAVAAAAAVTFGLPPVSGAAVPVGGSLSVSVATVAPAPQSPATAASVPTTGESPVASAALAATHAAGVDPRDVFLPRPGASPAVEQEAASVGHVAPLYVGSPAPMGLAYYGLSANATDGVVASVLNTTSLRGTVETNASGIEANDLFQSSPDSYAIQLNAVVTGVQLFGSTEGPGGVPFQFWTQNVAEFFPESGLVILVTNVWNFSGGALSANAFYAHGTHGEQVGGSYYFAQVMLPAPVTGPWNLTLFENSTVTSGRDAIDFSVVLASRTTTYAYPYDFVVFNSLRSTGPPVTVPANYTADGFGYNPMGLTNDFELAIGGPGDGSQATLFTADATLGLAYWDGSAYVSVPAAFNYAGETGETSTGANVAWSDAAGGPGGLSTFGTMTTGPSLLEGLWNATTPEGSFPLTIAVHPANAFSFVAPRGLPAGFGSPGASLAPDATTDTFWLPPGSYAVTTELSEYAPVTTALTLSGPMTLTLALTSEPALGVYTPLWAFDNSELAAISSGGVGSPTSPYLIVNNELGAGAGILSANFGLYNDAGFPVYPGVFLKNINASTELLHPAPFATATNTSQNPGTALPAVNDLQFWFWNVTNVSLIGAANLSGWFASSTDVPVAFDPFNVIFYESMHNLVAENHFATQGQGLLAFSGGNFFGRLLNVGNGNNTVWGNNFTEAPPAPPCPGPGRCLPLIAPVEGLGLELGEPNDLVYNNYFATPTTAWLLPINLYTGYPEWFTNDLWNITPQPAAETHFAPGFPEIPLTGSIVGGLFQGGNFWWDYGSAQNPYNGANNPYGGLPYEENATTPMVDYEPYVYNSTYIFPGGDYAPLLPFPLVSVTFHESGLPTGTPWGATITSPNESFVYNVFSTGAPTAATPLPNGAYRFLTTPVGDFLSSSGGSFRVVGHALAITLFYRPAPGYALVTFHETGLPVHTDWSVSFQGSGSTAGFSAVKNTTLAALPFLAADGSYTYTIGEVGGFAPSVSFHQLSVSGPLAVYVHFTTVRYPVTFTETGLAARHAWKVTITGGPRPIVRLALAGVPITIDLPNGSFAYRVAGPAGWIAPNGSAAFVINGTTFDFPTRFTQVLYTVSITESGLPIGSLWTAYLAGKSNATTNVTANFSEPNGTFHFRVVPILGFRLTPAYGSVRVHGKDVSVSVTYSSTAAVPTEAPEPVLRLARPD